MGSLHQIFLFTSLFFTVFSLHLIPERLEKEEQLHLVKRDGAAGEAPVCEWSNGGSSVHWSATKKGLRFSVSMESKKGKLWSAIGVGESMANLKLAIAFTENGKVKQVGGYKSTGYQPPAKEKTLKVTFDKKSVKEVNGQMSFDLVVPAEMFAEADANGCVTLQFGINAGQYQGQYNIRKHDQTPTPLQVCNINKCGADQPKEEPAEAVEGSGDAPEKEEDDGKPNPDTVAAKNGDGNEQQTLDESPLTGNKNETVIEKTTKPAEESKKDETGSKATLGSEDEAKTSGSGSSTLSNPSTSPIKDLSNPGLNWIGGFLRVDEGKAKEIEPHSSNFREEEKALTVTVHPCRPGHTDLRVCQGYFSDYLGKVEQWANRHGETMGAQLWKACSLLSVVQHVPTMCCNEFHSTCKQFVQDQ